jgi:SAM-dependent methyltransferase
MTERTDRVWQETGVVNHYLEGVRAAIPLAQEQIDVMLRLMAAASRPMGNFLDLGCGDGVLAGAILGRFPGARGVLADFSAPMLEAARKRLGDRQGIQCLESDYGAENWTQQIAQWGPFDAVVSGFSIHHQPDVGKRKIYAEIHELLAPGGVFVNIEHVASPTKWLEHLSDELFVDHLHRLHPDEPRQETADRFYYRPDKSANILAPVELQCEWLREIGYSDVDCYLKIFELAVFGGVRA